MKTVCTRIIPPFFLGCQLLRPLLLCDCSLSLRPAVTDIYRCRRLFTPSPPAPAFSLLRDSCTVLDEQDASIAPPRPPPPPTGISIGVHATPAAVAANAESGQGVADAQRENLAGADTQRPPPQRSTQQQHSEHDPQPAGRSTQHQTERNPQPAGRLRPVVTVPVPVVLPPRQAPPLLRPASPPRARQPAPPSSFLPGVLVGVAPTGGGRVVAASVLPDVSGFPGARDAEEEEEERKEEVISLQRPRVLNAASRDVETAASVAAAAAACRPALRRRPVTDGVVIASRRGVLSIAPDDDAIDDANRDVGNDSSSSEATLPTRAVPPLTEVEEAWSSPVGLGTAPPADGPRVQVGDGALPTARDDGTSSAAAAAATAAVHRRGETLRSLTRRVLGEGAESAVDDLGREHARRPPRPSDMRDRDTVAGGAAAGHSEREGRGRGGSTLSARSAAADRGDDGLPEWMPRVGRGRASGGSYLELMREGNGGGIAEETAEEESSVEVEGEVEMSLVSMVAENIMRARREEATAQQEEKAAFDADADADTNAAARADEQIERERLPATSQDAALEAMRSAARSLAMEEDAVVETVMSASRVVVFDQTHSEGPTPAEASAALSTVQESYAAYEAKKVELARAAAAAERLSALRDSAPAPAPERTVQPGTDGEPTGILSPGLPAREEAYRSSDQSVDRSFSALPPHARQEPHAPPVAVSGAASRGLQIQLPPPPNAEPAVDGSHHDSNHPDLWDSLLETGPTLSPARRRRLQCSRVASAAAAATTASDDRDDVPLGDGGVGQHAGVRGGIEEEEEEDLRETVPQEVPVGGSGGGAWRRRLAPAELQAQLLNELRLHDDLQEAELRADGLMADQRVEEARREACVAERLLRRVMVSI